MAESIKEKVGEAGHKIAETCSTVGHKIGEGVEKATDWAKEKLDAAKEACGAGKTTADIHEHMDVIGSCGNKVGSVDHVEGASIKLTRKDSPDDQHHYIPLAWVEKVDRHVHLSKNCGEAKQQWNVAPVGAGAGV